MNNTKLQQCWIWNDSVTEFIRSKIKGYTLNIPCGKSTLGDVRADIEPTDPSIVKVDMRKLPWNDSTFDTVIQDPPWKIGYYQRMTPFFECVRVCKMGGALSITLIGSHKVSLQNLKKSMLDRMDSLQMLVLSRYLKRPKNYHVLFMDE
jgi:hypothetical protein